MTHAKSMFENGIISKADYIQIDTILAKKYGVDSCNIYRGIDLIYSETRGNIGIKGGDIYERNKEN